MKKTGLLISTASALALLSAGCGKPNTYAPPPAPEVTVQTPEQRDVTVYMRFPGQLSASESIEVRARVRGYLENVAFDDGAVVEKDQLLFEIEPDQYAAQVEAAKANVAKAEAMLKLADTSLQRLQQAYETKAVSELDVLNAQAEKNSAEADLLVAQANLKNAEIDLSYTEIKSPIQGRASRHMVSTGNLVGDDNTLLTTVVSEDPIYIYFNVDERFMVSQMGRVENSRDDLHKNLPKVSLELTDGNRYEAEGNITYFNNVVDSTTGTLSVRAEFPNAAGKLLSGLFARVLFPHKYEQAVLVPSHVLQRDMVGAFVLTVDAENKVVRKNVDPGPLVDGDLQVITEGLDVKDRVIITGLQRSRPDMQVTVGAPKAAESAE